ncbi:MAG TPA: transcriptional regulator [Arsenophonus nasoniae]|uniref:transcriptional regulator n=1 Tax=Arsenophonus nasoniae TaxID=638 RepID=UPI003879CE07
MKLNDYLSKNSINQQKFAALVGATQGFVSHVITGRSFPSGRNTLLWSKATNWCVTPHELNPDIYPNPTDGIPANKQTTI